MRADHLLLLALMGGCASGAAPEADCEQPQACAADPAVDAGEDVPADAPDVVVDAGAPPFDATEPTPPDAGAPPPPIDAMVSVDAMVPNDAAEVCGNAMCEASETCTSCSLDCAPPDGPAGLMPANNQSIVGTSVFLDWSPHCDATSYDVATYWYNPSIPGWTFYFEWSTATDHWTFWPVVNGAFYFEVRASNEAGTGPYSAPSYFSFTQQ